MKYRIEIQPPDIKGYRTGNTGVDYVHALDSGKPGPTVMVQALTHGNEFSGAIALDFLMKEGFRPTKGKAILAFANVPAFERFDFDDPDRSRFIDEDYNRVWADEVIGGSRQSAELRRARELRPFVDAADYLLDLHTMTEPCRPIMVCGMLDKGAEFARRVGVPGDLLIDTGHPAGLRMRDRGGFGDPKSPKNALLIEAGQHWEKSSVDVAIDTTLRFLKVTGVVDESFVKPRLRMTPPKKQRVVRVTQPITAATREFRFAKPWKGLEVIPKTGSLLATDGQKEWRTPYDDCVLVMPSTAHVKPGNTMVRLGRYED